MPKIEIKATFKNINIKDKTVLQFELSPFYLAELLNMTKLANTDVMLTIESEQPELPLEEVEVEPEYDQPQIPIDAPEPVEETIIEAEVLELPEPGLPEGEEDAPETDGEDRDFSKAELTSIAEELGIDVPSRATKADIQALIDAHNEESEGEGEE